jgi:MinD superfamily P-loop ATPase
MNGAIQIDEFACEGCGLCAIACPAGAITIEQFENNQVYFANCRFGPMVYGKLGIAEENSGKLVAEIRRLARESAREQKMELILTDGPPGIGCPVISSVSGADLVVAITEPTLSGWHDLERLLELIGQFQTPVKVIIDKYDLNEKMSFRIEEKLRRANMEIVGKIPYDSTMISSLVEGRTIREYEPAGPLAETIETIWHNIYRGLSRPKSSLART